jgi:uncharacterized coiled-coil protein SlyX
MKLSFSSALVLFMLVVVVPYTSSASTSSSAYDDVISLVTVGNPGVGKSFLCNVILQHEAFRHSFQASACTTDADSRTATLTGPGGRTYRVVVHNVPGLIEHDAARLALNKKYIAEAFAQPGQHIVLYVFGAGRGGRLEAGDFAAYEALNAAYGFDAASVVFVFNMMPVRPDRTSAYDDEVVGMAMRLLQWPADKLFNYVFINSEPEVVRAGAAFDYKGAEAAVMRNKLYQGLQLAVPHRHEQVKEIELDADRVQHYREAIGELERTLAEFEKTTKALEGEVAETNRQNEQLNQRVHGLVAQVQRTREELEEARKRRDRCGIFCKVGRVIDDIF